MLASVAGTGDWLRRHVEEIAEDAALRAYGAVLAALHVLVAYWLYSSKLFLLEPSTEAVCWPLVPGCEALRVLTPGMLRVVVLGYGALALATTILFLRRRTARVAVLLLAGLVAIEVAILSLDFRLRRNQHYMSLATMLTFLLLPGRRDNVRVLMVLFYVWAGVLKLDFEWLSGSALYKDPWLFTGRGIVVACVYVVVLELFVVWGMLARSAVWFWSAFAQVIVFHIFSWPIVGYFYPILMMMLLTIFVLCRAVPVHAGATSGPSLLSSFLHGRAAASVYVTATVLSALQILPYLYPGDVALTGEGRLYALNMFDAKVSCEAYADVKLRDGTVQRESLKIFGEPRTGCDPILVRAAALSLCRSRSEGRRDFVDIDVRLLSRRESGTTLHTLVALDDFCARPPSYDPFFHNEWISTEKH
jgi:voltage-gated potassium channel Kch